MRRAATVLLTAALTSAGLAALASPASAAEIEPVDLTITVTHLGSEDRTCDIDADLYIPAGVSSAVVGSISVFTELMWFAGKPPNRACSRTTSSFGAM